MDNYIYFFDNNLYINLTNKCTNACNFCVRNKKAGINSTPLWLDKEPSAQEVIAILEEIDLAKYPEIVFCGYGEPTARLDVMLSVAQYLKSKSKKTRLNTNGQSDLINGTRTAQRFLGLIDTISISLNHHNALNYQELCHSVHGARAFDSILSFAKDCVALPIDTTLSVVDTLSEEDLQKCQQLSEQIGAKFLIRKFI